MEKKQRQKEEAKKRQEKLDDKAHLARVKAQIAADKEERRLRAERERAERAGVAAPQAATASIPGPTTSGPVASKPASAYTETRLRLQTSNGNIMKTVPVTTTLFEVAESLKQENGLDVHSFTQTFPKKVFDNEFFGESLKDLGLVPSASLIVQ